MEPDSSPEATSLDAELVEAELQEDPAETYALVAELRDQLQNFPDMPHPRQDFDFAELETATRIGPNGLSKSPGAASSKIPRNRGDAPQSAASPYKNMPRKVLGLAKTKEEFVVSSLQPSDSFGPECPDDAVRAAMYEMEVRIGQRIEEWMQQLDSRLAEWSGARQSTSRLTGATMVPKYSEAVRFSKPSVLTLTPTFSLPQDANFAAKADERRSRLTAARNACLQMKEEDQAAERKRQEEDQEAEDASLPVCGRWDDGQGERRTRSSENRQRSSESSEATESRPSRASQRSQRSQPRSRILRKLQSERQQKEAEKERTSKRLTVQQVLHAQGPPQGDSTDETNDGDPSAKAKRFNALSVRTGIQGTSSMGMVGKIVMHAGFDYFFAGLICFNSIFIGVQTQYQAATVGSTEEEPLIFSVIEKTFVTLFLFELIMRMIALRLYFFTAKGKSWNLFDLVLVSMSFVELGLEVTTGQKGSSGAGGSVGKVIRMFRMARIVRIMRVLRFLAELRVMVTLIMHSMRSLFWLMILLVIILYVFAICFTQAGADFRSSEEGRRSDDLDSVQKFYGSLGASVYTLFMSITGGVSWGEVLDPLAETGSIFTALFVIYIFFAIFSVLNIVTGVFVDGAIQRSGQERDLRLEKEREQKETYVNMLLDLLEEIDSEGNGTISRKDLEDAFQDQRIRHYFSILEIDISESSYLFDMLDLDRSGEVDWNEFVEGCARLKGSAKSIDVHTLMFEIKMAMAKWEKFMLHMEADMEAQAKSGEPLWDPPTQFS